MTGIVNKIETGQVSLADAEKRIEQIAENEEQEETDEGDVDADETEDDVLF